ncbi:MAG TPA: hypothetical protein VGO43_15485 [Pyrinomonadaceae bacterium]|nr:hypothetical protein [Pyrinomonadaceae bacterium]
MREALVILVVLVVLLALTAVKYRRQINGIIGVARMLKDAKAAADTSQVRPRQPQARAVGQLINCAKCGVWVPRDKATERRGSSYCERCARVAK